MFLAYLAAVLIFGVGALLFFILFMDDRHQTRVDYRPGITPPRPDQ